MKHLRNSIAVLLTLAFMISCDKEITLVPENGELNSPGIDNVSARPSDMIINEGELYALYPYSSSTSVHLYYYNVISNELMFNYNYSGSTGSDRNYGFDYNYNDGLIYLLAAQSDWEEESDGYRNLYTWNKDTNEKTFIEQIVSADDGDARPQDLTFGNDGTLYFVFKNGEINAYNVVTETMSEFTTVDSWQGGVGLTYDFDNNRLILSSGYDPINLYSIDIPSGEVNPLFSFYPSEYYDYGNAIEYVGNNKLLVAGRNTSNINSVDLDTEEVDYIGSSNYSVIKDFMFFVDPDLDDDGVLNENDPFPNSNMSASIYFGENDLNIDNEFVKPGTTMMDQIDALIEQMNELYNGTNYAYVHKKFTSELAKITYYWYKDRLITSRERSAISRAAWSANVPNIIPR